MHFKKIWIGSVLFCFSLLSLGCPNNSSAKLFHAEPKATSYAVEDIKNLLYLGSRIVDKGVSFNLYSENATRIELLLFDDPESSSPSQVFVMSRFGNVWSIYVEGIGKGTYYAYRAWGPNWPYNSAWRPGTTIGFISDVDKFGNRFNPNKVLMDPYARALHRDHDWSKGSAGSGYYRDKSTVSAAAKSIVIQEGEYGWSTDEMNYWNGKKNGTLSGHGWEDLIIYEVHVKGFSMDLSNEISYPGTYKGLGEKAAYFKELGITAVELMPIHEADDETYWHYMTIGFFAPEVRYAYRPEKGSQINEFKWMVEQLHKQGIEVILDVVFNHTGEGGLWRQKIPSGNYTDPDNIFDPNNAKSWAYDPVELATIYDFRGIDNQAYYGLGDGAGGGNRQEYWESTGVGNMVRCNNTPGKQLILDSLRYWVTEFHVDGFRFDLANTLGRQDSNHANWNQNSVLKDIVNDTSLQTYKTRIIAEPWDAAGGSTIHVGEFPKSDNYATSGMAWYEWNDRFRNWMRKFINVDAQKLSTSESGSDGGSLLTGSQILFYDDDSWGQDRRAPYHSVNFITAHDGFTLYDLLSYNAITYTITKSDGSTFPLITAKRNGKGPLNPQGEDPWSGDDNNNSLDWSNLEQKRQMHRNLAVLLFLSHGTPMMLGGDEWMRTQFGNNNAYTKGSDNQYNWFRWNYWKNSSVSGETDANSRWRMVDFYKKLINFRKTHKYAFELTSYPAADTLFSWKNNANGTPPNWTGKNISIHYHTVGAGNKQLVIAINIETTDITFTLPSGLNWELRIDTQFNWDQNTNTNQTTSNFGEAGSPVNGTTVTGGSTFMVKARSICVFEEQ